MSLEIGGQKIDIGLLKQAKENSQKAKQEFSPIIEPATEIKREELIKNSHKIVDKEGPLSGKDLGEFTLNMINLLGGENLGTDKDTTLRLSPTPDQRISEINFLWNPSEKDEHGIERVPGGNAVITITEDSIDNRYVRGHDFMSDGVNPLPYRVQQLRSSSLIPSPEGYVKSPPHPIEISRGPIDMNTFKPVLKKILGWSEKARVNNSGYNSTEKKAA